MVLGVDGLISILDFELIILLFNQGVCFGEFVGCVSVNNGCGKVVNYLMSKVISGGIMQVNDDFGV